MQKCIFVNYWGLQAGSLKAKGSVISRKTANNESFLTAFLFESLAVGINSFLHKAITGCFSLVSLLSPNGESEKALRKDVSGAEVE